MAWNLAIIQLVLKDTEKEKNSLSGSFSLLEHGVKEISVFFS